MNNENTPKKYINETGLAHYTSKVKEKVEAMIPTITAITTQEITELFNSNSANNQQEQND